MKQLFPILAACLVSWAAVTLSGGSPVAVFFGMVGPLVAVGATWLAAEHVHRRNPAGVSSVLMAAFGLKVLFFGAYIAIITKLLDIDMMAFMASFVIYFIALYIVQAVLVRRLTLSPVP
jgi:hypothetical protein